MDLGKTSLQFGISAKKMRLLEPHSANLDRDCKSRLQNLILAGKPDHKEQNARKNQGSKYFKQETARIEPGRKLFISLGTLF